MTARKGRAGRLAVRYRRRLAAALDALCGVERDDPVEEVDYTESAMTWQQRDQIGRPA